ncbi:hypothetical protein PMAYCL1PPCAC_11875, partial [Pristionchus mayeri]
MPSTVGTLPIRGAALRQILRSIDPAPEKEVKGTQPTPSRTPVRKPRRSSNAKTGTPNAESKVIYRTTPPSSPEPAKKGKKPRKAGGQESRNLVEILDKVVLRKRKYVKKIPKMGVWSDEETEEETEDDSPGDISWFDGIVTPEDLDVNKLRFDLGSYFIGRYKILHLISIDESRGATYIVYRNNYELVFRVNFIQKDDMELMNTETKFLQMMELNDAQHYFSTIFDVGYVNKNEVDGLFYYATIYRGGPTLLQCHRMCSNKVSAGSIDRLAGQMVKIFEQMCGQGYRLLSFSLEDFTIDARSRVLFLSNYTNIVKVQDAEINEDEVVDMTQSKKRLAWHGEAALAPIKWHRQGEAHVMSERDLMESLIYLLVQMHTGKLPWANQKDKEKWKIHHSDLRRKKALIHQLPPS